MVGLDERAITQDSFRAGHVGLRARDWLPAAIPRRIKHPFKEAHVSEMVASAKAVFGELAKIGNY